MTLVDASAWIEFFGPGQGEASNEIGRLLSSGDDLGLVPIVITEVLQGCRSDTQFDRILGFFRDLPLVTVDREDHVEAARLYRRLRRLGITVSATVDCLIAALALRDGLPLLSLDDDFREIAKVEPLRLVPLRGR